MSDWSVYLVRASDGTLYTGIATDVVRRFEEHGRPYGKGAKYLRGRGPLELVLQAEVGSRAIALRLEKRIKKLSKARKEELVATRGIIDRMVAEAGAADGDP